MVDDKVVSETKDINVGLVVDRVDSIIQVKNIILGEIHIYMIIIIVEGQDILGIIDVSKVVFVNNVVIDKEVEIFVEKDTKNFVRVDYDKDERVPQDVQRNNAYDEAIERD